MPPDPQLHRARAIMGPERLLAFFKRLRAKGSDVLAVTIVKEHLATGRTLDEFFAHFGDPERYVLRPALTVRRLSKRVFLIDFGIHGNMVGDGGEWRVVYSARGRILRMRQLTMWVC